MFDLDGVLLDSEQLWNLAKREVVDAEGGRWREDAPRAMMGMSSPEWVAYMRDVLAVQLPPQQVNDRVVARLEALYRDDLPLLPGAVEVVRACAERWPVGLASSSNRELIDLFLTETGLDQVFTAAISSEEVPRGKPAPDVYLAVAAKMQVDPANAIAIEDSSNGIRAAAAAGMTVIAVPNPHYPPEQDALELAARTITHTADLTPALIASTAR